MPHHLPFRAAFLVLGALCGLLNCLGAGETPAPDDKLSGEIVVGATFPLSGTLGYYGQSAYYGANTRVKIINASGGVNGKRLVIKWRDNKGDPEQTIEDVRALIEEFGVNAVLGPLMSDSAMKMRDISWGKDVVFVSPFATSDAVTKGTEWVFRACFNNTDQAKGMTAFQIRDFGARSCAILFDPRYRFSTELASVFEREFRAAGGKVVGILSIINYHGDKDYAGPLKKLANYNPDFIYVPCYGEEAAELMHAARDLKVNIRFAGPLTWDNELVFIASGRRLAGTAISSAVFEKTFSYRPFQRFYQAMEQAGMDFPDAIAASAYDAVTIIAEGLKKGEKPSEIRDGILEIHRMPMATGVFTIEKDGTVRKPVIIRYVEEKNGHMVPIFAELFESE